MKAEVFTATRVEGYPAPHLHCAVLDEDLVDEETFDATTVDAEHLRHMAQALNPER